ncbi:replication initiator [Enemella evansiae]|uniref:replication initiator n=1 Tax=Enemella evansiae TaxID=2016499 RepID=UPI003983BC1B
MVELTSLLELTREEKLEVGSRELLSMPCARPLRLSFRSGLNQTTGEVGRGVGEVESIEVRCRSNFHERCAPCAARSARDAWMIGAAGISGLDTLSIPEPSAGERFYFLTLTAPSFGPVHSKGRCRCGQIHSADDDLLHLPVGPEKYDYHGAAVFNLLAGRLWNRTITRLKRVLGSEIQYLLASEPQKRGSVHYHVIIRSPLILDPGKVLEEVSEAVVYTGRRRSGKEVRWGPQTDFQSINPGGESGRRTVNYIFKAMAYTRKSATDLHATVDASAVAQSHWDRLETQANSLRISGEIAGVKPLRTRRYGAFGGFTGHRLGRSRGWALLQSGLSLSLARLRALRAAWTRRGGEGESDPFGETVWLDAEPQHDPKVQEDALLLRARVRLLGSSDICRA